MTDREDPGEEYVFDLNSSHDTKTANQNAQTLAPPLKDTQEYEDLSAFGDSDEDGEEEKK